MDDDDILREIVINPETLWKLSGLLIGTDWENIGYELRLDLETIENIKLKCKGATEYRKYMHQMLAVWREQCPGECNLATLVKALKKLKYNSSALTVVNAFESEIKDISSPHKVHEGQCSAHVKSKISYDVSSAMGTVIFKGKYDEREAGIKLIPGKNGDERNEMEIFRLCYGCPNIIQYFGMEECGKGYYLATELCLGNLAHYITDHDSIKGINLETTDLLKQITDGLNYLHQISIIHFNLKPENILICLRHTCRPVISDFGESKDASDECIFTSQKDSNGFTAYESLEGKPCNTAVDVFSLGCVYYYVHSKGKKLFYSNYDVLNRMPEMPGLSEGNALLHGIIESMIKRDPVERPNCSKILHHPIFWDPKQILEYFQRVADYITNSKVDVRMVQQLLENARHIFNGDWKSALVSDLNYFFEDECARNYDYSAIEDLIRLIRNKSRHYGDDVPVAVQNTFGKFPEGYVGYFISKFPNLLFHTYKVLGDLELCMQLKCHNRCDCEFRLQNAVASSKSQGLSHAERGDEMSPLPVVLSKTRDEIRLYPESNEYCFSSSPTRYVQTKNVGMKKMRHQRELQPEMFTKHNDPIFEIQEEECFKGMTVGHQRKLQPLPRSPPLHMIQPTCKVESSDHVGDDEHSDRINRIYTRLQKVQDVLGVCKMRIKDIQSSDMNLRYPIYSNTNFDRIPDDISIRFDSCISELINTKQEVKEGYDSIKGALVASHPLKAQAYRTFYRMQFKIALDIKTQYKELDDKRASLERQLHCMKENMEAVMNKIQQRKYNV